MCSFMDRKKSLYMYVPVDENGKSYSDKYDSKNKRRQRTGKKNPLKYFMSFFVRGAHDKDPIEPKSGGVRVAEEFMAAAGQEYQQATFLIVFWGGQKRYN